MSYTQKSHDAWKLPANFELLPSTLNGITVYGPHKETKESAEKLPEFKCPNCGASTRYDVAAGGEACEHCGYMAPVKTKTVGEGAKKHAFTLESFEETEQGWGVQRREVRCESCGADLALSEDDLSATCPFCASNQITPIRTLTDTLRPHYLIPFKIQGNSLAEPIRKWLGRGWFHPGSLRSSAALDRVVGIYLPFWIFSCEVTADWKAEAGYERKEDYYDSDTKEWKTRTTLDWKWESGHVDDRFSDIFVCGSSHVSHRIVNRIQPFELKELAKYDPKFLGGWRATTFDVSLDRAWKEGKAEIRDQVKTTCRNKMKTNHVRNFSMITDFNDEAWRLALLPVYLSAYRFNHKVYQVMANGQNGTIAGQKPVAWIKVWLAICAILLPGLAAILSGIALIPTNSGTGIFLLILSLFLLVPGGILSFWIYSEAIESEAA